MNEQDTKTALQLFQILQQMLNPPKDQYLQNMSEQLAELSHQVSQLETKQQQSLYHQESVKQELGDLTSKNELLENASKSNHMLGKQHYNEHIVQPMVRSLFPVLDLIADAQKHWSSSEQIAELLDAIWSQMEQFLAVYDVHVVSHVRNDIFEPLTTKPITWIETNDSDLDGLIAESLRVGFQYGQENILRLETVSLFKYQSSKIETNTLIERTKLC